MLLIIQLLSVIDVPAEWKVAEVIVRAARDLEVTYECINFEAKRPNTGMFTSGYFRCVIGEIYAMEEFDNSANTLHNLVQSVRKNAPAKFIRLGASKTAPPRLQGYDQRFGPGCRFDHPLAFFPWPGLLQHTEYYKSATYVGEETVQDLPCSKFCLLGFSGDVTEVFISMDRDGHIIKWRELMDRDSLQASAEMVVTRIQQIVDGKGVKRWFPTAMKKSRYYNPLTKRCESTPNYWSEFIFVPTRVKLNTGLKADDVDIKFDSRLEVKAPRKVGKNLVSSKRDVKTLAKANIADLKKTLAEADAQKAMFDDRKRAAPLDDEWPWVWIGGILTVAFGAAAVYFKMRHAA